jgi:hypothetical protein
MLLGQLVLGPRHLHAVTSDPYLDPSPAVVRRWCCAASDAASAGKGNAGEAAMAISVLASAGSSGSSSSSTVATVQLDLGKLKLKV